MELVFRLWERLLGLNEQNCVTFPEGRCLLSTWCEWREGLMQRQLIHPVHKPHSQVSSKCILWQKAGAGRREGKGEPRGVDEGLAEGGANHPHALLGVGTQGVPNYGISAFYVRCA